MRFDSSKHQSLCRKHMVLRFPDTEFRTGMVFNDDRARTCAVCGEKAFCFCVQPRITKHALERFRISIPNATEEDALDHLMGAWVSDECLIEPSSEMLTITGRMPNRKDLKNTLYISSVDARGVWTIATDSNVAVTYQRCEKDYQRKYLAEKLGIPVPEDVRAECIVRAEPTPVRALAPVPGSRWRHLRTEGVYEVVSTARLQVSDARLDLAEVVVYKSTSDGNQWVRPTAAFLERFEPV